MPDPVIKTIDVPCPPETAFRIFTADIDRWWPKDKHAVSAMSGAGPARAVRLEPRQGGAVTETGADGATHVWGSVAEWDPHSRFALLWHINKPVEEATTVAVDFAPIDTGARVTLTHAGWEALGDAAHSMRDGYDQGWVYVFQTCYGAACAEPATAP